MDESGGMTNLTTQALMFSWRTPSSKTHIFKRGTFWWCKGLHSQTQRSIAVHGTTPGDAFKRWDVARCV